MLSLNDAMLKKRQEPTFAMPWDALEPEEQIVRAIIEGREENHLTQEQLADVTGIHQTNISKLESGTANPSLHAQAPCRWDGDEAQAGICPRAARVSRKITIHPFTMPGVRASLRTSGAFCANAVKIHKAAPTRNTPSWGCCYPDAKAH